MKRFQLSVLRCSAALFLSVFSVCSLQADVWTDCDGWFNNPVDKNGNGKFDDGDLIDSRFGGDSTSTQHQTKKSTYTGGAVTITTEDVVSACGGKTLAGQKCIHLDVADVASTQGASIYFPKNRFDSSKKLITNDSYTVLFRYRQDDDYPAAYKDYKAILFNCACERSGSNKSGFCLAVQNSGSDNKLYLYGTSYNDTGLCLTNSIVTSKEGVWTELAVIVRAKEQKITFGLFQPGCAAIWRDYSPSTSSYTDLIPYQGVSSELRFGAYYGWTGHGFKGSMNMAAFWNRALTTSEVYEAFSGGAPSVVKIGFDGSGHEMFAGTETSVSVKATDQDLRKIPSSFSAGTQLAVSYSVPELQTNLAQVARIVVSKASATFDVKVDGVSLGEVEATPSKPGLLFVPAEKFTEGDHTLTLACTAGSGATVDCVELTGSWRLGLEDGKDTGFGGVAAGKGYLETVPEKAGQKDFYLGLRDNTINVRKAECNPGVSFEPDHQVWPASRYQNLHFNLTQEMVERGRYEFSYRLTDNSSDSTGAGVTWPPEIEVVVNGVSRQVQRLFDPGRLHTLTLSKDWLQTGENTITTRFAHNLEATGTKGHNINYDYYKLALKRLIHDSGLMIILR